MRRAALAVALWSAWVLVAESALPETYREAREALERGDATRCAELLEPALAQGQGESDQLAPAQLALGIAWLRLGKADLAVTVLEKAAAHYAAKPEAPDAWSPLGDAFRVLGRIEEARRVYGLAAGASGDGVNTRYAQARLREMDGEAKEAAGAFNEAADAYLAAADRFLALGSADAPYWKDARVLYERVGRGTGKAGRDWRGEPTARSVFGLGELEKASGHLPEAIAYYQRTFVSWPRYPVWAARAYLRAAECMDQLGKRAFAIRHLRELVRKVDRFGKLPEYERAKVQLRAWGEDVR